jgi:hypothetical protein
VAKGLPVQKGTEIRHSDAVWQGELKPVENKLALSFRDLPPLPFVVAFIRAPDELAAHASGTAEAQERLKPTNPFARTAPMEEEFCYDRGRKMISRLWSVTVRDRCSGITERSKPLTSDGRHIEVCEQPLPLCFFTGKNRA